MNLDPITASGQAPEESELPPAPGLLSFDGGGMPLPLNSRAAYLAVEMAQKQYELAVRNGLI